MTYSNRLERYPDEFQKLLIEACTREIEIPFADPKAAKKFQGRFYAFVGAVRIAVEESSSPQNKSLLKAADKVQVRLRDSTLVFRPLDRDDHAQLIRSALNIEPAVAASPPAWLQRLAEKKGLKIE